MAVNNLHPNSTQDSHTLEYPYRIYSTDESQLCSPGQTGSPAHGSASFSRQNNLSAQTAIYNNQSSGYFDSYAGYLQCYNGYLQCYAGYLQCYAGYLQCVSGQGQQKTENVLQTPGLYFNWQTGSPSFSSLTPDKPTYHGGEQYTAASYPSLDCYVSLDCDVSFVRQTDYDRHMRKSRKHNAPEGPTCPLYGEDGCRFEPPLKRLVNFKAHYMRRHRRSSQEADEAIQDWKRSLRA